MSNLERLQPTIIDIGVFGLVEHDMPCAVYYGLEPEPAVYSGGVFEPSRKAQKEGWRLILANTWFKRLVYRWVFEE
jgi:hypothetical protein